MSLVVYNTLSRQKEAFKPLHPKVVRIYTCGLTTYAPMHIGHARTYCFWDLFRRYLEYRGLHVLSAINYTDVDDRIIQRAEEHEGPVDFAERNIAKFRADCRLLRIKDYSVYTRATDFVGEQLAMIEQLSEKGHAYAVDGEVLYQVETFSEYGKLSGNTLEQQRVGASGRVQEDSSRKRHPADFTLWKPGTSEPKWSTPRQEWSEGRPGWHIECSAMSTSVFGEHFDVHGGGVDNLFPHHENEIAQSQPLCGSPWVKYWLHPEHLDLKNEKMSKSLGNVIGISELLERRPHDEVRWFFAAQHYRSKLPFSWDLLTQASQGYARIRKLVQILEEQLAAAELPQLPAGKYASQRLEETSFPRLRHQYIHGRFAEASARFIERFTEAMDDDLNTPQATAALFDYVAALYQGDIEAEQEAAHLFPVYRCLTRHLAVLGVEIATLRLYPELCAEYASPPVENSGGKGGDEVVNNLLKLRAEARAAKDFARSDAIRDLLVAAGVTLEDKSDGVRWSVK